MPKRKKLEIIPAILVLGEDKFIEQTQQIAGLADMVQIDIADGNFVPNSTWADQKTICKYWKKCKIELHFMVNDPLEHIKNWVKCKCIETVFFHYESPGSTRKTIEAIKKLGLNPGLAINPDTPVDILKDYYKKIDKVMLMSVHPGFQGQTFIDATLTRIYKIKKNWPNLKIEVDGGVKKSNLKDIYNSGADGVCVGSEIFGAKDPAKVLSNLQSIAKKI